jgi:hypothetical protein
VTGCAVLLPAVECRVREVRRARAAQGLGKQRHRGRPFSYAGGPCGGDGRHRPAAHRSPHTLKDPSGVRRLGGSGGVVHCCLCTAPPRVWDHHTPTAWSSPMPPRAAAAGVLGWLDAASPRLPGRDTTARPRHGRGAPQRHWWPVRMRRRGGLTRRPPTGDSRPLPIDARPDLGSSPRTRPKRCHAPV